MLRQLISMLFVFIPVLSSAQSIEWGTPEYKRIIKDDCEGKVFTKYETLPTFKIPKQAFEDSLTLYLKENQAFDADTKFSLFFLLTKKIADARAFKAGRTCSQPQFLEGVSPFFKTLDTSKK